MSEKKITHRLYYEDSYMKEFRARVTSCRKDGDRWQITLDSTVFYPEGGGQPSDQGILIPVTGLDAVTEKEALGSEQAFGLEGAFSPEGALSPGEIQVVHVREEGDEIIHLSSGPAAVGTAVLGRINWGRRFDLMQQHSGEHIVSGLIHRKYGYDNVGFHMGEDFITIDLSGLLTMDQALEIEEMANDYLLTCRDAEVIYPEADQLASYDYRSKKDLQGQVRLMRFPGADLCACCGLHVANTGEIGLIKILSCRHFREGVRIEMISGKRALKYLNMHLVQNSRIGAALSVPPDKTEEAVARLQKEIYQLKGELIREKSRRIDDLAESCRDLSDVLFFVEDLAPVEVRKTADRILGLVSGTCAVLSGNDGQGYHFALGVRQGDIRPLLKEMNSRLQGRGGGTPLFAQGVLKASWEEIAEFFQSKHFIIKGE